MLALATALKTRGCRFTTSEQTWSFTMKFLFLLSTLTLAFASPLVNNATLNARANGLAPTVDSTVYLVDGGAGTYPRLAHLADGSVLGTVTTTSGGNHVLTVTRSTDGGRTFSAWSTISTSPGDLDNTFLQQLANGDIVAAFRNHDKNGSTYTIYRVRRPLVCEVYSVFHALNVAL